MIHYHGTPITPQTAAARALHAGHAFISFAAPNDLNIAIEVCQSFAVDNGAFSAWKRGTPVTDWRPFYEWVGQLCREPGFDFAVIPDVIDGSEEENDALVSEWPLPKWIGAPVWHMHESVERLVRLAEEWPRVCIGSSGEYSAVGTTEWWECINRALLAICDDKGKPICKLHGLRMLNPKVFGQLPLSSADSTNVARNIGIDKRWTGSYQPPTKEARAWLIRERIESVNGATAFDIIGYLFGES